MKKYDFPQLLRLLAVPGLLVILGLILLFSPDTASALVGKILAWCCILAAVALGAGALLGAPSQRGSRVTWAAICFAAGVWMLLNPLTIAKFLGRVLGITLMIRGGQSIGSNLQYHNGKPVISSGLVIAAVTVLVGAVLVILPMASSRMLFSVLGVILICVGIAEGVDRIRGRKLLDEGSDPNIIDVEKL